MIQRQKKTNMKQENLWGIGDDTENEQEEIEEKLRYPEEEISKLRNINEEFKSGLNYELEEREIRKR